jgi:hypothetical protein
LELALVNARLRPLRPDDADGVLVRNGRIARVGPSAGIRADASPDAEIVDLGGRVLTPGIQDAHFHFFQAGIHARRPTLAGCRSLEDFRAAVSAALSELPGSEPLAFESWDETMWNAPDVPTRETLDALDRRRPIIARRICGHFTVANTPGLQLLSERWNGPGIDFEAGHLVEEPSLDLDQLLLPDEDEARLVFEAADRLCLERGITTACDFLRPGMLQRWVERVERGEGGVRVNAYLMEWCFEQPELVARARGDRFAVRGLKIFSDGTIGGRTAAVMEPYADRPGGRGDLLVEPDALVRSVRTAHDAGWSVAVHAIGDRAIGTVLDAFAALPTGSTEGRGHRMEHVEMARPRDRDRMRALGVRPCVQPNFLQWAGPDGLYERALGAERLARMNPFRSFLEEGCHPFFGSDGMPTSPVLGLRLAVNHPVESQRLSGDEALRLYTEAAAGVPGHAVSGRVEAGEIADLAVFPTDPETMPDPGLADLTVLDGRIVHRSEALERARRT